jgi:hypothetical protein
MDKQTYLSLPTEDRALYVKLLLKDLVSIKKKETEICKRRMLRPCNEKFKLEQRVLQLIAWEKEENQ